MSAAVHAESAVHASGNVAAVVASLPVSLHGARPDEALNLVAIDGGAGWSSRLAEFIARGARGAVVVDPAAEKATPTPVPVVIDRTFASHPSAGDAADAIAAADPEYALEVRIEAPTTRDAERALLDAVALARVTTGVRVLDGRLLARTPSALLARAQLADGRPVLMSIVHTDARPSSARARLLSPDVSVTVDIPAPDTARPAIVVVTTAAGETRLPARFESAHRHSWRRLLRGESGDLDSAAADADAVHRILGLSWQTP